jgi:polyisoprenoid-binding protein YceI
MKQRAAILSASLLIGLASGQALAAETFKIDPAHTNIVFMINHLGYSNMIGQFQDFEGSFVFDQDNIADAKIDLVIKAASVDTDHQARDDHLRSPDFFNAQEFPEITFVSTKVEKTGEKTGTITGDLTILGQTRPVTLDVTFNKVAPHPIPSYNGVVVAGFSARGTVDRIAYGMSYAKDGIGNQLDLILEVEGHKQ